MGIYVDKSLPPRMMRLLISRRDTQREYRVDLEAYRLLGRVREGLHCCGGLSWHWDKPGYLARSLIEKNPFARSQVVRLRFLESRGMCG